MDPNQQDVANLQFELEEYRQVMEERRLVMNRYTQAVGLYLALSGFAGKELLDARSWVLLWLLAALITALNGLGIWGAGRFRSMARHAMLRESHFVQRYKVQQMHSLYWGYHAGLVLVFFYQVAVVFIVVWRLTYPPCSWNP